MPPRALGPALRPVFQLSFVLAASLLAACSAGADPGDDGAAADSAGSVTHETTALAFTAPYGSTTATVRGAYAYVLSTKEGTIRILREGRVAATVAAPGAQAIVASDALYWSRPTNDGQVEIWRAAQDGSGVAKLSSLEGTTWNLNGARVGDIRPLAAPGLAADADALFVADINKANRTGMDGILIRRIDKRTGQVSAVDEIVDFDCDRDPAFADLTAGDALYGTLSCQGFGQRIVRMDKNGGSAYLTEWFPANAVNHGPTIGNLVVDEHAIYFTKSDGNLQNSRGAVHRIWKDGSGDTTLAATQADVVGGGSIIGNDANSIYFDSDYQTVAKVSKNGGPATTVMKTAALDVTLAMTASEGTLFRFAMEPNQDRSKPSVFQASSAALPR